MKVNSGYILGCVVCAVGISIGQLLFKMASARLAGGATFFDLPVIAIVGASFAVYAITSLYWIWILQRVALSAAYPFLAITYIVVPIAAAVFFGEIVSFSYWVGVLLVVSGLILISR